MLKFIFLVCAGALVAAEVSKSDSNSTVEASTLPGLLEAHRRVVTCFVSVEAIVRSTGQLNVDCNLCTHIVYTGLLIDPVSAKLKPRSGFSPDLKKLKRRCPHIKQSLSVHQDNGTSAFSMISNSDSLRKEFVTSVLGYVQDYEYDGLDLNLNLENATELAMTTNKSNFVLIVKDLRQALGEERILTASLSKDPSIIDAAYDLPAFAEHVQYLHVKSFDYHDAEKGFTAPVSPLRSTGKNSVVSTIEYLKSVGAPTSKLVLGVPMFGRTFLLKEVAANQPFGSAVEGGGMKGPFTNTTGFMGYNEICLEMKNNNGSWDVSWDALSRTPYAQSGLQWMSYEDERSVAKKVQYAVREELAGVAVWTLDLDDTQGRCSDSPAKKFPLLNRLHTAMVQAGDDTSDTVEEVSPDSSGWIFPLSLALAVIGCLILAVAVLCLKYSIPLNCPDAGMV